MKKIIVTGAVAAIAAVSFAGTASAARAGDNVKACFGQIHQSINKDGTLDLENVGQLVQLKVEGEKLLGQGKNAAARGLAPTFCLD